MELAIAILAIIKAGSAYVPLDPSYPRARLEWMLTDAKVSAILSDRTQNLPPLSNSIPFNTLSIDITDGRQQPTAAPPHTLTPENSVYVIYTSGSTGTPKGVINTHQGVVNRLCWMQQAYGLTPGDRVLHKTPIGFDVSVWELFWPLLTGAAMVIAKPGGHQDSAYLVDIIRQQQISTVHFVPSMLAAFLETPDVSTCVSLQRVICSGETLPPGLQQQFFQTFPHTELHNLYGPTEAAIDVTAWQCQPGDTTVPIGYPIANTQIHLLDRDQHPVPIGVPGELYIGGVGVAQGYLNRPELTAEKFIANPLGRRQEAEGRRQKAEGKRQKAEERIQNPKSKIQNPKSSTDANQTSILYKTGDLARYRADGAIEYIGRRDNQVKLRGIRIELGEIESALNEHPIARRAAVLLRDDLPGGAALVAYVVRDRSARIASEEVSQRGKKVSDLKQHLVSFLKTRLPEGMIPSVFVDLDVLPLTPNGKLDRRVLPRPEQSSHAERVRPRNSTEKAIATLWSDILQMDDISVHDNFFELGGHSLSATRLNARLRQQFKLDLPLHSIFEYPTVEAIATHIDALRVAHSPTSPSNLPSNSLSSSQPTGHKEIEL
jgi:amino acid adenylation domain-containing protein